MEGFNRKLDIVKERISKMKVWCVVYDQDKNLCRVFYFFLKVNFFDSVFLFYFIIL